MEQAPQSGHEQGPAPMGPEAFGDQMPQLTDPRLGVSDGETFNGYGYEQSGPDSPGVPAIYDGPQSTTATETQTPRAEEEVPFEQLDLNEGEVVDPGEVYREMPEEEWDEFEEHQRQQEEIRAARERVMGTYRQYKREQKVREQHRARVKPDPVRPPVAETPPTSEPVPAEEPTVEMPAVDNKAEQLEAMRLALITETVSRTASTFDQKTAFLNWLGNRRENGLAELAKKQIMANLAEEEGPVDLVRIFSDERFYLPPDHPDSQKFFKSLPQEALQVLAYWAGDKPGQGLADAYKLKVYPDNGPIQNASFTGAIKNLRHRRPKRDEDEEQPERQHGRSPRRRRN